MEFSLIIRDYFRLLEVIYKDTRARGVMETGSKGRLLGKAD